MVEQIDNPANKAMHYGDTPAITLVKAPERLPKKVVYSNAEANKSFNQIQHDIYVDEKKAKPKKYAKFPLILKIVIGAIGLSAIIACRKDLGALCKKYLKNPFKKASP